MAGEKRPNVVFILADNLGWGDLSCYGGVVKTSAIDGIASAGVRLTNYNVEAQCTPTRAAIMTGRMPIRSGTSAVPLPGHGSYGLCAWEFTIAQLLSDAGYSTALYGKWHEGDVEGRLPTDKGFDEWWGIKNTSDEAGYTSYAAFNDLGLDTPKIWEGRKGQSSQPVMDFDVRSRPVVDAMIADRAVEYLSAHKDADQPFFLYLGLTQLHTPFDVHPDFVGKSGGDRYSDALKEMDANVGRVLDALRAARLFENTIVVFSSDNGTLKIGGMGGGSSGPWKGHFMNPPYEGCYRVPALVSWPSKIGAGQVSDQMLAAVDWMPTIAGLIGEHSRVPSDRPIDGVDASDFLYGNKEKSGRESFVFFGPDSELMSVKWRHYKVVFRYSEGMDKPIVTPQWPLVFDLLNDPHEDWNIMDSKLDMFWVFQPVYGILSQLNASREKFRDLAPGEEFAGYTE